MTVLERLQAMPAQGIALPWRGFIRYRESMVGTTPMDSTPFVLLHGIGSGSGSWVHQLEDARLGRVLAWDAPGYADSSPLKMSEPTAADYAHVLWAWLDAMQINAVHLVGHSLGAIMAGGAARLQPERVKTLTLLSPAQGYGSAAPEVREKKRDERLQAMQMLGLQKMAEQRAPRLLAPDAPAEHIELAIHMMSHLNPGGYTQATQLLSQANLREDLQAFRPLSAAPVAVACGELDIITPPAACQALADFIGAPYSGLSAAGHLCALQAPQAISQLLCKQQGQ